MPLDRCQPEVQFIIDAGQDVTQLALKRQGLAPLLTELGGLLPRSALQAIAPKTLGMQPIVPALNSQNKSIQCPKYFTIYSRL